jgi:hypothetical protein
MSNEQGAMNKDVVALFPWTVNLEHGSQTPKAFDHR